MTQNVKQRKGKPLQTAAQYVKGVGPHRYELLTRLGIHTVYDLLTYVPRSYEDRSNLKLISQIREGEQVTVRGTITDAKVRTLRRRRTILEVYVEDETDGVVGVWFNQDYLYERFKEGDTVLFSGKVKLYKSEKRMHNPYFEVLPKGPVEGAEDLAELETEPIVPIYHLTEDLSQNVLRKIMKNAIADYLESVPEMLPSEYRKKRQLLSIRDALKAIHFPASMELAARARKRLAYDEFFILELGMSCRRRSIRKEAKPHRIKVTEEIDRHIRALFPFEFTDDQSKVISEITQDLESSYPMNRLLQGDVGSGKTVVAVYALLSAVACGYQGAIMAPTEILASQHCRTLADLLARARVKAHLILGSTPPKEKKQILEGARTGDIQIIIGTHALIQKSVTFKHLAVLVVDEQHKFGVLQRDEFRKKGEHPDCLVMTATPIPRTLMLSVFGDLDVSTIERMPPGRVPVETIWVEPKKRAEAHDFVKKHIDKGRQVFIVYPLVKESENSDLKAATEMADRLQFEVFPELTVGLLHGQMKSAEKEEIMDRFRRRLVHILVSTIVVEVGVDVPNASIMIVEHAERFGLAQLHQLRGRIGRGRHKSYFLLFADARTQEAKERLKIFTRTRNGFRIAEEDLKIRGPGQFFGTAQHGLPELTIANLIDDYDVLRLARKDAFELAKGDPDLRTREHALIREALLKKFAGRLDLIRIG
jgi:ATP-dependent DNA helicase RecG